MKVVKINPDSRSARRVLEAALEADPQNVMMVYELDGKIYCSANSGKDRLWRMGALAAAMIEEWTYDGD